MSDGETKVVNSPLPRWMIVGFIVAGVASVLGLVGLVLRAVAMIRDGRGIETYKTFWGVEFSWIGVLVGIGASVLALVVAVFFRWREERQWRALEKKYGAGSDA